MSQKQSTERFTIPSDLLTLKEEKQIIIHCRIRGERNLSIHPLTFLMCNKTYKKVFILFCFGAPLFPKSNFGIDQEFTLIFSALDLECEKFSFIEGVLQSDLLSVANVQRNKNDIYFFTFGK